MGLLFLGLGDKTKLSLHADDNKFVTRVLSLWSRSLAGRFFKFLELVYSMLDVWCYKTKCFVTSVWSINELVNKWLVLLNSRNPNQSWFIWIETTASEEGRNSMFVFFFFFCKVKFREKKIWSVISWNLADSNFSLQWANNQDNYFLQNKSKIDNNKRLLFIAKRKQKKKPNLGQFLFVLLILNLFWDIFKKKCIFF